MFLMVKVIPNAQKNALVSFQEGILKVRIHAAPEKGKANEALVNYLAELLDIPRSHIRLVSGESSRLKRLEIQGEHDMQKLM